mmetsp:Transcript_5446/g.17192  ORF Transcript_5446/g.17192 Transcript_5446/m.17192 type:complete len:309 (+) Transcript_5446:345-1271(+)
MADAVADVENPRNCKRTRARGAFRGKTFLSWPLESSANAAADSARCARPASWSAATCVRVTKLHRPFKIHAGRDPEHPVEVLAKTRGRSDRAVAFTRADRRGRDASLQHRARVDRSLLEGPGLAARTAISEHPAAERSRRRRVERVRRTHGRAEARKRRGPRPPIDEPRPAFSRRIAPQVGDPRLDERRVHGRLGAEEAALRIVQRAQQLADRLARGDLALRRDFARRDGRCGRRVLAQRDARVVAARPEARVVACRQEQPQRRSARRVLLRSRGLRRVQGVRELAAVLPVGDLGDGHLADESLQREL